MNRFGFKAQFGSANYNLVLPTSDADYITYLYPSFDDMYDRADWSKPSKVTDTEDNVYNDIRKLRDGLIKANPTAIEILYSVNVAGANDPIYEELKAIREEIARANLPVFYDAMYGMFTREMKTFDREIAAGKIASAGKHAASAFRIANILKRYAENSFTDYQAAIWYEAGKERDWLLEIKRGEVDSKVIKAFYAKYKHILDNLKPIYKAHTANEEVIQEIKTIVYYYVKKNVARDLGFEGYKE